MRYLIFISFLFVSFVSFGQHGMLLAVPSGDTATYLLDDYPGAIAAYGMNKLSSTATNCVTIKRSSDGDTLVVGFSGGDFDAASASAFVGGNDAWVQTWWDQSGTGYNAYQTDSTQMPLIYSSGTLVTENSKAAMDFDGTNDWLRQTLNGDSVASAFSFWGVVDFDVSSSGYDGIYATNPQNTNGFMVLKSGGTDNWGTFGSPYYPANTDIAPSASIVLISMISSDGNSGNFYLNGSGDGSFLATTGQVVPHIGGYSAAGQYSEMQAQVIVVYPSDQSANRTAIETILNNYYSIY